MHTIKQLPAWINLEKHFSSLQHVKMTDLFKDDPQRFQRFSLTNGEILLDYSKNRLTSDTISLLLQLADTAQLREKIQALFQGAEINTTEHRPALHTLLRNFQDPFFLADKDVAHEVSHTIQQMQVFTDQVRNQEWRGFSGKPITDIVNIGIGGSHLGPQLTTEALAPYAHKSLRCHFISNIDDYHLWNILNSINPETSLFIISSKSFNTIETQTNATTVKQWFLEKSQQRALQQHFVCVTAAAKKAVEFGIDEKNIFPIWNWVGGRYSIWSAIGLPLALMIGMDNFQEFLRGAAAMDHHFESAEFGKNLPVLLALIGIWYTNFFHCESQAIIPYTDLLNSLPAYLQQADMESNGKRVNHAGVAVDTATGPIIWGGQGCNGQHAYYQLLHQGKHLIPIDFILTGKPSNTTLHHDMLIGSALSQAQALMQGKTYEDALAELIAVGMETNEAEFLALHKTLPGNNPSNVIFMKEISPFNLGSLIAMYEHKIFVQGAIWDINSYDQWGVELGKQLLPNVMTSLETLAPLNHDSSTLGLINFYRNKG